MATGADREREEELQVRASEVDEKLLRARVTDDARLLAEARAELDLVEGELAELRVKRIGRDRIQALIEDAGSAIEEPARVPRMFGAISERLTDALGGLRDATALVGARVQVSTVLSGSEPSANEPAGVQP